MKASELRPGQIEQIKRALKCARNALEKGIEVRMMDQWPALALIVPDAIREVKAALEIVAGWDDEPSSEAKQLNIDAGDERFELARALHRVVRAMHDGHCPKCGHLASSMEFEVTQGYHCCPECEFAITKEEADEALAMFLPYMQKNYDKFAAWQLHGRFVKPVEPAPSTPDPQPFRAGDLVVCVDGGGWDDQIGKMFEVCYADEYWIGFGKPTPQWKASRFRHATAAEIAAHRASTVAIHELNDGVPSRIDVEVPQIAIKVEPEYVVTSKPTTEQYIVDGHDRLISQEGSNVTLFQRTYDIGSQEGRDALQKVVAMIQDVLESKHEPDLGPQRGPVSVAQIEAQTKAVRREMEWPPELVAQVEQKRQDDEGWIEWDKGYCPPGCEDKVVEIRTERYGDLCKRPARMTHWERKGDGNDITHYRVVEQPEPVSDFNSSGSKYLRKIVTTDSGCVDVYAVLLAFNVTCPARQHAIKKLLCSGIRGKGDGLQDLQEARDAVDRAIQLNNEPCGVRE